MDSAPRHRGVTRTRAAAAALVLLTLMGGTLRADAGRGGTDRPRALAISAVQVEGGATDLLWPGRRTPVRIEIRNRTGRTVQVSRVHVRIAAIHAPRASDRRPCTRRDFKLHQVSSYKRFRVGPRRTAVVEGTTAGPRPSITIVHRPWNQDGCQAAQVRLVFTVGAVRGLPRRT